MSVRIERHGTGSKVAIAIDYAMPSAPWERVLAIALGRSYARWCVRQMAGDLVRHFAAA